MFGFFGIFGRSRELRRLDQALRTVDLHPAFVPDAVKLTTVRLIAREDARSSDGDPYADAAALVAYCMVGADVFAEANGEAAARLTEARIEAALESGDSVDARLILLTLHAKLTQPSVVDRFGLEIADG